MQKDTPQVHALFVFDHFYIFELYMTITRFKNTLFIQNKLNLIQDLEMRSKYICRKDAWYMKTDIVQ